MSKVIIKDVKVETTEYGLDPYIFAELELVEEKNPVYYYLNEVQGFAEFYSSNHSLYNLLIKGNQISIEESNKLEKSLIHNIGDIDLSDFEYDKIYEEIDKSRNIQAIKLVKLLIALVRLDWNDTKKLVQKIKGKELLDITIPVCEEEQEYFEAKEGNN